MEALYIFRLAAALFTITLAIVGLARHEKGDSIGWLFLWWFVLACSYTNLVWAIIDTVQNWAKL